jgi:hypothetical protein
VQYVILALHNLHNKRSINCSLLKLPKQLKVYVLTLDVLYNLLDENVLDWKNALGANCNAALFADLGNFIVMKINADRF